MASLKQQRESAAARTGRKFALKKLKQEQKRAAAEARARKAAEKKAAKAAAQGRKAALKKAKQEAAATRQQRGISLRRERQMETEAMQGMTREDFGTPSSWS